ncbi:hypothetical protein [Nonomuraea typhae]|uniref:Protein kinase domain-containing protein n=1 Tax=Nonomuraea typhae TaxID=2603600 RepID=A0ABW7Z0X7_9ACTN
MPAPADPATATPTPMPGDQATPHPGEPSAPPPMGPNPSRPSDHTPPGGSAVPFPTPSAPAADRTPPGGSALPFPTDPTPPGGSAVPLTPAPPAPDDGYPTPPVGPTPYPGPPAAIPYPAPAHETPQGRRGRRHATPPPVQVAEPGPVDRPLEHVIGNHGPLAPVQVAAIGLAVLDQLVALHARGEHHGDIRPGNILLSPAGQAILVPPLMPNGISAYTAPEGATGPAADLWSLGATLFAAVEGLPPAPGAPLTRAGALAPVLYALLSGDPAARPAPVPLRQEFLAISQG